MRASVLTWVEESIMADDSVVRSACKLTTFDSFDEMCAGLREFLADLDHSIDHPPIAIRVMTRLASRMGDEDGEIDVRLGVEVRQALPK